MNKISALIAAILLAALMIAWWSHREADNARADARAARAEADAAAWEASAARADVKRITTYVDRLRVIHDTTAAITKDIPRYVTPETDRRYPLPVGFVRLHDAAATGVPIVESPGDLDAARSEVTLYAAAEVIVDNYGTCHAIAEQLSGLQDWVRSREAAGP